MGEVQRLAALRQLHVPESTAKRPTSHSDIPGDGRQVPITSIGGDHKWLALGENKVRCGLSLFPMSGTNADFSTLDMTVALRDHRWMTRRMDELFFKMSGPGPLVDLEKPKFLDFLRSHSISFVMQWWRRLVDLFTRSS